MNNITSKSVVWNAIEECTVSGGGVWNYIEDHLMSISESRTKTQSGECNMLIAALCQAGKDNAREFIESNSFRAYANAAHLHAGHTQTLFIKILDKLEKGE